jgi:L-lactate dehydrogenase complex protein LldE
MLADKKRALLDSGAEVCVALDNSCLMHIGGGLRRDGVSLHTLHLAQVLARVG